MTLKELHKVKGLYIELEVLKEKIEKARDNAQKVTTTFSLTPGGGQKDVSKLIESIVDYEKELCAKYIQLYREKSKLQCFLNQIEDPIVATALTLKYDNDEGMDLSWAQVARKVYGNKVASGDSLRKACARYIERF